jgi:multimeric flavodoxin WrbA
MSGRAKIIGFSGSPRQSGNTAWSVLQILNGAEQAGAETIMFSASELNITPCRGCLGCVKGCGCVTKDDMQKIYAMLKDADALVLGMPIYMGQMSAQTKAFTDRLFAHITPRFSPRFKEENAGKKLILAFTQGNPEPDKFKTYIDYTAQMFGMLEFKVQDVIIVAGTRSADAKDMDGLPEKLAAVGAGLVI